MADRGLQEAIRAVGGVTELARRIGISQPSVSNWTRIPAERVLEVESANAVLLKQIGQLHGDEPPLGAAHRELAEAAKNADAADLEREYSDLFVGVGRGELLPYASYYLTGFLHERPLARLRQDLARFGVARSDGVAEPEDHAGILCEIMAGLTSGELPAPEGSSRAIFEKHMAPWIARFFADLEGAEAAEFYRRVGTVGRVFIEIETEAFTLLAASRGTSSRRTGDETGQ